MTTTTSAASSASAVSTARLPEIVIAAPRVMDADAQAALRAPFPLDRIGMKPVFTCGDCRKTPGSRCCANHSKRTCPDCGGRLTTAHIHLDYVGHADVTDRLLAVDPLWDWEPLAVDERGLPALDQFGGMWIKLTICGVTRIGYGDAEGKHGPNAVKEVIGDAIKVTAMRFGVGLDLWQREPPPARQIAQVHVPTEQAAQAVADVSNAQATQPATEALEVARRVWLASKTFLDDLATPDGQTLRGKLTQIMGELDRAARRTSSAGADADGY